MNTQSFDHLVGAREQRRGHIEAKRLRRLEVNYQLVPSRCLHRQVARLLTLQDTIDIAGCPTEWFDRVGTIGEQAAIGGEVAPRVNRRQAVLCSSGDHHIAANRVPPTATISPLFGKVANSAIPLVWVSTGSSASIGVSSMACGGAIAWITANWPIPCPRVGSRSTPTRVTCGAISLSNSSHFPARLYSN